MSAITPSDSLGEVSPPDRTPSAPIARRFSLFRRPLFRWNEVPGFRESILWFYGFALIHQVSALIVGLIIAGIFFLIHGLQVDLVQALERHLFEPWLAPWLGGEQLLSLVVVVWLYRRRFRFEKSLSREFALPNPFHFAVTFLLLLPMGIISTWTYLQAERSWQFAVRQFPPLERFDQFLALNAPSLLAPHTPFAIMLIIFAVLPAIGEELVFRGVIGRGLTRRLGLLPGILITSFLFGVLHSHPLHAAAVIPLGITLHILYLTTGSLAAPMLLHFLNNATAVATLAGDRSFQQVLEHQRGLLQSPSIVIAAVALVAGLLWSLYQTRTRADSARLTPACLATSLIGLISFATLYCRQFWEN